MRENFFFGGGASTSSMTPAALAITLVAAMLLLVLPRKQAPAPILIVAFLIPFGQQIMVGGAHFFAIRIVIMAGLCRLLAAKISSSKTLFPAGFNGIDKAFSLLLVVGGTAFIIRQGAAAAIVYQTGFWLDAFGMYFIFRHLLQDREDIFRLIKMFAFVAAVLGTCMSYEYLTRVDLFSYLAQHQIVPWVRDGKSSRPGSVRRIDHCRYFRRDVVTAVFLTLEKWGGKAVGVYWACVRHCRRNNFDGQHSDYRLSRRDSGPLSVADPKANAAGPLGNRCRGALSRFGNESPRLVFAGSGEHRKRKCL